MADTNKFAGSLAKLGRTPEPPAAAAEPAPQPQQDAPGASQPVEAAPAQERGRRARPATSPAAKPGRARAPDAPGRRGTGKRSDPDWRLTGLFVRRDTQADVMDRLRRTGEYADASELTQALWERWLKKGNG